ncbi:TMEM56 [Branchiostoma lanceolatum]|nr:TMEM56 [Branchiostoma lanceolatum]
MSAANRVRVCNSTTSFLHALIISTWVMYTFAMDENLKPENIRYESYYVHVETAFTVGYALSDTVSMIQQQYHPLVLHHVLLIIVGVTNTFIWPFCEYFGHLMVFWEVSNIFMNLRNILKYLGYDQSSSVCVANAVTFALTFFLCRIAPMPLFWYQVLFVCFPKPDSWRPEFFVGRTTYCCVIVLHAMCLVWFLHILQSVKEFLFKKSHVK